MASQNLLNKNKDKKRTALHRWLVVGAMFVMVFTGLGFCSSNKGLFLSAITQALDMKRSLFSLNDSCRYITTAVVNLFFGSLIAKFGPRKLIAAGFLALCVSSLLYATVSHIALFCLGGCFLGMGLSWTSTTMVGYVVNRWCKEHKGTVMGFVLAANGLGGALAAQILTPIIYGDPFGFRKAYFLVAAIVLTVGAVIVLLFRDAPGEPEGGQATKNSAKATWAGISFAQAVRRPYFYTAALCVFFAGASLQSVNGVAAAHMADRGLSASYIGTVTGIGSLALAGAKFLTGVIHDRIGLRKTMLLCQLAAVAAFAALLAVGPADFGLVLALVYAVMASCALPLETIMLPLIAGDLFGEHSFARIMGVFVSVNTAGYALGAPIANLVFDLTGSYALMLIGVAVIMLVSMPLFQWTLTAAEKDRL